VTARRLGCRIFAEVVLKGLAAGLAFLLLAALFLVDCESASAQDGRIPGTVTDDKGRPLAGVQVVLRSADGMESIEQDTTDREGSFSIAVDNLRPGHVLYFHRQGYDDTEVVIQAQQLVVATLKVTMSRTVRVDPNAAPQPSPPRPTPVGIEVMTEQEKRAIRLYNEAVKQFEDADADDPKSEQDRKDAERKFREAASLDPNFEEPVRILLRLAVKKQLWAEASRHAETLIRIDPSDEEAVRTAYLSLILVKHFERVGLAAKRLVAVSPESITAVQEHAAAFLEAENYMMARALYEALAEILETSADTYLNLGFSCAALGDVEGTRAAFEMFITLAPEDHPNLENVKNDLANLE
jgi:tetratricopeptide (TPR) repeat protein